MSAPTPSAQPQTHLTALALVPPLHIQALLFPTRNIHDRSSSRYPAHITLPFIEPADIGATITLLRETFVAQPLASFNLEFEPTPGVFRGRKECIVHLSPTAHSTRNIRELWLRISRAVDPNHREDARRPFAPHLTVGQAPHDAVAIKCLEDQANIILGALTDMQSEDRWTVGGFVVLRKDLADAGVMKAYASIATDGSVNQDIPRILSPSTWPTYIWDGVASAWTMATPETRLATDFHLQEQHQPLRIVVIDSIRFHLEEVLLSIPGDAHIVVMNNTADPTLSAILAHPSITRAFIHSSRSPHMAVRLATEPLVLSKTSMSVRRIGSNFVLDLRGFGRMAVPILAGVNTTDAEAVELLQSPGLRLVLEGADHARTGSVASGWRVDGRHLVSHGSQLDRPSQSATSAVEVITIHAGTTFIPQSIAVSPLGADADDVPFTDADLLAVLPVTSTPFSSPLPSARASAALQTLESLFRAELPSTEGQPGEKGPVKIGFAVVGATAFGLGDDDPNDSDPLEIAAIGNISPKAFRGLLLERLGVDVSQEDENLKVKFDVGKVRRAGDATRYGDALITLRVENDVTGQNQELRVKLWYAMDAELVERRWSGSFLAETSATRGGQTQQSLPALNKFVAVSKLHANTAQLQSVRIAYSFISRLAQVKSVWSARFGYLSSNLLFDALAASAEDAPSTATLVWRVLKHLFSPSFSPYYPATVFQAFVVRRLLSEICADLVDNFTSLASLVTARDANHLQSFVQCAERDVTMLIQVDVSYWGAGSVDKREAIMTKVEERLIATIQTQNEIGSNHTSDDKMTKFIHLYPARLRNAPTQDGGEDGTVSWLSLVAVSPEDMEHFRALLEQASSEAAEDCFVEAKVVSANDVDQLVPVVRQSARSSDSAVPNPAVVASPILDLTPTTSQANLNVSSTNSRQTEPVTVTKLRPAPDIYHRLIWTPPSPTTSDDYVIGYEDRFDGVREMRLGGWRKEVEDEAFIPFHRVVYFKRTTDGVLVWDRAKKLDLIFGSGLRSH